MENNVEVDVRGLLDSTIISECNMLAGMEIGNENRKLCIDAIEKLNRVRIEEAKILNEFYVNNEKRLAEQEFEQRRIELEERRLDMEEQNQQRELELKEEQLKAEKQRAWIDLAKAGGTLAAWLSVTFAVMKFEETGSIRSKAFLGTIPKIKLW